jgi:hypothetical protein
MTRDQYFQEVNDRAKRDAAIRDAAPELLDALVALVASINDIPRRLPLSVGPIALPVTVHDLIEEYQTKLGLIETGIEGVKDAVTALHMTCCVQGTFVESLPSAPAIPR